MQVQQQRGMRRGHQVCILLLLCSSSSTLLSCFSPSSSFLVVYLLQKAGRTQSGARRDWTDAGHDINTGRDKGAVEWEEEAEGRAGGLSGRVGGGGKQGQAGDRNNVTAA